MIVPGDNIVGGHCCSGCLEGGGVSSLTGEDGVS